MPRKSVSNFFINFAKNFPEMDIRQINIDDFRKARSLYLIGRGIEPDVPVTAALIDMDGVLYDSMPLHARAWQRMISEQGIDCTTDEFFLYEGMTGAATIDLIFRRAYGRNADPEEAKRLYAIKSDYFKSFGAKPTMQGADRMIRALQRLGMRRVLVTGSGQASLIQAINHDYPGAFADTDRVTANDVSRGKPDPEPYLRGLAIAGTRPENTIVIENAPLGVRAGVAAGCFTIAVTTGPIPREAFVKEEANLIFDSMPGFADFLETLECK